MSFTFTAASAAEVSQIAAYLHHFDETIKFVLAQGRGSKTLTLSTVNVAPYSYTEIQLENREESPRQVMSLEPHRLSWAVSSSFFIKTINCFEQEKPIDIELADDMSSMILFQKQNNGSRTQVSQLGVLHQLGPKLIVNHGVEVLYAIDDISDFRQLARSASTDDSECCSVSLKWADGRDTCDLVVGTEASESSILLGLLKRPSKTPTYGSARSADLLAFSSLSFSRSQKAHVSPLLSVGFGIGGLTLFKLQWTCDLGPRSAILFFCTG